MIDIQRGDLVKYIEPVRAYNENDLSRHIFIVFDSNVIAIYGEDSHGAFWTNKSWVELVTSVFREDFNCIDQVSHVE